MCQSSGIQETLMQRRYVGCMDEIASAFSNIELMCWNIHHVPKCSVIEGMLERREPSVIGPIALFPAQAYSAGGHVREGWGMPLF